MRELFFELNLSLPLNMRDMTDQSARTLLDQSLIPDLVNVVFSYVEEPIKRVPIDPVEILCFQHYLKVNRYNDEKGEKSSNYDSETISKYWDLLREENIEKKKHNEKVRRYAWNITQKRFSEKLSREARRRRIMQQSQYD